MLYSNPTALGNDLLKLVGSPTGADIKFIIGEEKATRHGHSLILSIRCPYFADALSSSWREGTDGIFRKPNVRPQIFDLILQYIYSGQVTLDEKVVPELIQAADELRIKDLVHGCEEYALKNLSNENVFAMTMLASLHGLDRLRVECHDHIAFNFDILKKGRHILTLDGDNLLEVLAMDQLDVPEIEIWKVVVRWAYFQQGLDWEHCPLLNFPKPPGCVVVTTVPDTDDDDHQDDAIDGGGDDINASGDNDAITEASSDSAEVQAAARAVVNLSLTTGRSLPRSGSDPSPRSSMSSSPSSAGVRMTASHSGHTTHRDRDGCCEACGRTYPRGRNSTMDFVLPGPDEDGFRHLTDSVFQPNPNHLHVKLTESEHMALKQLIEPLLPSVRFIRIPSMDFLRLVEGTGLLPPDLCAQVYRFHAVPSMMVSNHPSLKPRMPLSSILTQWSKSLILQWVYQVNQTAAAAAALAAHHSMAMDVRYGGGSTTTTVTMQGRHSRSNTLPASSSGGSLLPVYNGGGSRSGAGSGHGNIHSNSSGTTKRSSAVFSAYPTSPSSSSSSYYYSSTSPSASPSSSSSSMTPMTPVSMYDHNSGRPNSYPVLNLLYRASRDGFQAEQFHARCDHRGPTVTVARTEGGQVIGGYNAASWSSHVTGLYSAATTNFLFVFADPKRPDRPRYKYDMMPNSGGGSHYSSGNGGIGYGYGSGGGGGSGGGASGPADGSKAAFSRIGFGPVFGAGPDLCIKGSSSKTGTTGTTMLTTYEGGDESKPAPSSVVHGTTFNIVDYEVFQVQSF
ncbi:hypothetical protein DFQ27_009333 [Actinomortierella ambigua]|uniref:BTB domain-containing protein n=1 Tax=Actinomortierella ambigua TaxID=1343610 RepID=A0A9P6PQA3_9FUNG|nr:hypothetical protein DFQ27_009333 [Actinomortierella ambigua]